MKGGGERVGWEGERNDVTVCACEDVSERMCGQKDLGYDAYVVIFFDWLNKVSRAELSQQLRGHLECNKLLQVRGEVHRKFVDLRVVE